MTAPADDLGPGPSLERPPTDVELIATVELLTARIARQQVTIAAMVDAAERRFEPAELNAAIGNIGSGRISRTIAGKAFSDDPQDDSAFGLWASNLVLHQEVEARTRRIRTGERLLRSVVDSLDARMCILGDGGTIIGTNRLWDEFAAEMGWYVEQAGLGGDFYVLVGSLSGDLEMTLTTAARQVLLETAGALSVKGSLRVGRRREEVVVRMTPITDEGAARVVVTLTDVTAVVRTQHELTMLEHQLAQATRLESIGQLAAGIAHEINTPVQYVADNTRFLTDSFAAVLTALQAADRLAAGDGVPAGLLRAAFQDLDLAFLTAEIPGALSQSQEGLARVSEIIRAMKDFAHPGTGQAEADLNRAIRSTVMVSRNEWRYVAELDLDLDPAVGMVRCFEGELKQVLLNIVVNAAQAIAAGPARTPDAPLGRITIRTERTDDGVAITIRDDGPGMDESVRRRVFDPFFTTKGVGQGTGQGLSLAYVVIVQKHGGTLAVTSVPGEGAVFSITLPDRAATEAATEAPTELGVERVTVSS